jgi:hypothetical protein
VSISLRFLPLAVIVLCSLQALWNESNLLFWGFDAPLRLLLEGVKHTDDLSKAHGIHSAVRVSIVIRTDRKFKRYFGPNACQS